MTVTEGCPVSHSDFVLMQIMWAIVGSVDLTPHYPQTNKHKLRRVYADLASSIFRLSCHNEDDDQGLQNSNFCSSLLPQPPCGHSHGFLFIFFPWVGYSQYQTPKPTTFHAMNYIHLIKKKLKYK